MHSNKSVVVCRICRINEPNSAEHLFQSAIGGRREVPGVLCKPCNERMGQTVDAELAKSLEWFRMLLAIEGDRGQTASVRAVDADGRKIILKPGAVPEAAEARPDILYIDNDTINLVAHSPKQARQIIEAYQLKRPDETLQVREVKILKTFPSKMTAPLNLNGSTFFKAAVRTALVLLAHENLELDDALGDAWRFVQGVVSEDANVKAHWSAIPAPWDDPVLGPVPHRVSVWSDPENEVVAVDVRYFGDLAFCAQIRAHLPTSFWDARSPCTHKFPQEVEMIGCNLGSGTPDGLLSSPLRGIPHTRTRR